MSAQTLEHLQTTDYSTEDLLLAMQSDLQEHAETFLATPTPYNVAPEDQRTFYCGENAVARITPGIAAGQLAIAYSSLLPAIHNNPRNDPFDITLTYDRNADGSVQPAAIVSGIAMVTSSMHSGKRQLHAPKLWPDGGYSLENVDYENAPSLDQLSLRRAAKFATQFAATQLIPALRRA